MKYNLPWIVLCFCLLLCNVTIAQDSAIINCGQKEVNDRFLRENPTAKRLHDQIEFQIADYTRKVKAGVLPQQRVTAVVTLPVVMHIIHNNGSENISDAQAITAIQNLNAAYANTGFYDPSNGVNTEIQFCLAQRDPSGNATNGITRNVSPYTAMGGPQLTSDDQNVKNLNRWNPRCYINIWLVRDIPGGVVGYAYLPSAHGSNLDGIVMEAGYFGSSPANDVVIIHEMGHYLGLYHTFDGGCGNTDCTTQGDRVCDTPPDQSTGWAACNTSVNSCSTDPLSGFSTDVNDLKEDYMDYGNWNCMKVFTQGQKDRMIWHINNVRSSLLNCNSCLSPCPAPVIANFTQSGTNVPYGATVNFTNTSTNASGYRWYVNGVLQSTATNFSYTFNAGGTFNIRMVALPGSPLCDSVVKLGTVNVVCTAPVTGNFTSSANNVPIGTTVNFTNTSVNASTYRWYINGVYQSAAVNFSNTFNTAGIYIVRLAAFSNSPICDSSVIKDTIRVDCPITASFTPLISTANVYQTINFTNGSTGATSYQWLVNGVLQGTATNFSFSFGSSGNFSIKLRATGATCTDSVVGTVVIEDTCSRETFQKSIGGPADDLSSDIQSTPDGGYIISGRTRSYGNGGEDGFIIKLDNAGTTQWSKTFGGTANDWFNAVITTSDGGFAAVGRTYSYGNPRGDAWFVKMDANGNVQWSRRFSDNTSNGEDAHTLVQTPDGGYAVVGAHDAAPGVVNIFVIKLDAAGNILWNRIYDTGGTDGGMHIINDGSDLMVAGFTRTSISYHDGLLLKLNGANGNIIWVKQYEVNGWNNTISRVFKQGTGYVVDMGAIDDFSNVNTGRSMMMTVDANGNATSLKLVQTPQYRVGGNYLLPMEDGSFVTLYNEENANPDFNIISIGSNDAVQYARHYPRGGRQVNIMLRRANDGGFISVGYTGNPGNYDIYFVKTDIQGNSPGCDAEDLQVSVQTLQPQVTDGSWSVRSGNYQNTVLSNVLSTSPTPILTELCAGTSCTDPEPPVDDDTCATTFQKTYVANGGYNAFYINTTSDGGSVIAGTGNPVARDETPESPNIDAFVMKLAKTGKLQWAKRFGGTGYDEFRKIRQTSDGGYIAIGSSSSFSASRGIYLVRISPAGNVIWSKNFSANAANRDLGLDVIQTSDGGFVFTATNDAAPPQAHGIVAKTDANGNITWHKSLHRDEGVDFHSVIEVGDTLVLGADYWVNAEQRYYGAIIKMHKSNGNILQSVGFSAGTKGSFATHVFKTATGYLVGVHLITGASYNNKQQGIVYFSPGLELEKAGRIAMGDINPWSDITPTLDSGFVATAGRYAFGLNFYLHKANKNGTLDFAKVFGDDPSMAILMQTAANAQQYPDGKFITVNTYNGPPTGWDGKLHVIKTNPAGETPGCSNRDNNQAREDLSGTVIPVTFTDNTTFNYDPATTVSSTVSDVDMEVRNLCESNCSIDSLIGPDSVCNLTDTITYELKRFGICTQPVEWTIDTNYARIVSITDSTIRLLFKQTGTVRLRVVTISCEIYTDSIDIHIFDSPDTLNLGPDIAICKISTWPLNARSGFKSYLWQDGSMDSTFTADQPGIYHVTVTDYCGNQLRDTVVITLAPDVPFDLGPDITICNEDTVTLTAPTGFTNYYWSPSYRVSNSYTREIKVNPDRDTTYTVVAERGPGCLVTDTIRVKVNRPTPLDLGIDKTFCRNDSVLLDAGPSFSDYLWNNNLTTQQIYAKTGGIYHVTATDINGCKSKDTVDIVMSELPVVNLGGDTIICLNSGVSFNAGIGNSFNIYLWQDGSTNNTYFGAQAGTYWVQVTNANNCKNSDTVKIIRVAELPSNFLADTIGICDGEQIELRAGRSFVSYQWDGLFNTPTITVKDESGHVLKVTDEYGCTGEDTIRVYFKFCRKRIWFPNAFTPNNDAHNSIFKPIVDGGLVKFHLVIYNRWGQKIFETQDAKRGWDGTISGHTQDTDTFVWVCTYKFIGRDQVEKTEKGIVILVR